MSLLLLDTPSQSSALGPLSIDGQFFRQGGTRTTLIELSDFSLYKRYLDGEDIVPILKQRSGIGANMLRVWLLNQSVVGYRNEADGGLVDTGIRPGQYPDFYALLTPFAALCGSLGLNVDYTVFTQTKTLMPDRGDQQYHLDQTCDAVRGLPNVIVSLVNENAEHDNAVAPGLSPTNYVGIIYSAGSNGSDAIPPPSLLADCAEYHILGNEWQRKTGHNAMEIADGWEMPCWTSESTRCPDNDSDHTHYEDAASGAALLCAGSCGHSVNGKFSRLFTGAELYCMEAHCRGARSVPLEYQAGDYRHRSDLETPAIIRAYSRVLPDGREHVVLIRK